MAGLAAKKRSKRRWPLDRRGDLKSKGSSSSGKLLFCCDTIQISFFHFCITDNFGNDKFGSTEMQQMTLFHLCAIGLMSKAVLGQQVSYITSVVTKCYDLSATTAAPDQPEITEAYPTGDINYSMPPCDMCDCPTCTVTSVFITTLPAYASTGTTQQTITVTETYVGMSSLPTFAPTTTIPYGFTEVVETCTVCGPQSPVMTMTYPVGGSSYTEESSATATESGSVTDEIDSSITDEIDSSITDTTDVTKIPTTLVTVPKNQTQTSTTASNKLSSQTTSGTATGSRRPTVSPITATGTLSRSDSSNLLLATTLFFALKWVMDLGQFGLY